MIVDGMMAVVGFLNGPVARLAVEILSRKMPFMGRGQIYRAVSIRN